MLYRPLYSQYVYRASLARSYSSKRLTLGIRSECKNRWERRTPLTPEEVKQIVEVYGGKVIVQPSKKRIFTDDSFKRV
jgi:alpha-aminoadipic semialdehyde synthase